MCCFMQTLLQIIAGGDDIILIDADLFVFKCRMSKILLYVYDLDMLLRRVACSPAQSLIVSLETDFPEIPSI